MKFDLYTEQPGTGIDQLSITAPVADGVVHLKSEDQFVLYICKGFSGEIMRVSVDQTSTMDQLIPEIADQISYVSTDWEKIGLYNLTRDFEFRLDDRLDQTRTQPGDLVIMADGAACHK